MKNVLNCSHYVFNADTLSLSLFYELNLVDQTIPLEEKFQFSASNEQIVNHFSQIPPVLLESLHLLCAISYYKFFPDIQITHPYELNENQSNFWNSVYHLGLGEYVHRNQLSFADIFRFTPNFTQHENSSKVKKYDKHFAKTLLLFGGGKDSYTSLQILKKLGKNVTLLVQNPKNFMYDQISQLGLEVIFVTRTLPPALKQLKNFPTALDGHIPITMIIEFVTMLAAVIYDFQEITVSSEYSANFGNIIHEGIQVNHQWDKSYEAEVLLQDYLNTNLSKYLRVFSILRPLYDVAILKIFAKEEKFLYQFISCNRNFRLGENSSHIAWCGNCSKCAFVFLALAPFVSENRLIKIFGKNLFMNPALEQTFLDLCGMGNAKPFECVGTFDECNWAVWKLHQQNKFSNTQLLEAILSKQKKSSEEFEKLEKSLLGINLPHSLLPEEIDTISQLLREQ